MSQAAVLPQILSQGTWIELQPTLWWSIVELAPSVHLKVDFHCRVIFTSESSYFYARIKQILVGLRNRTAQRRGRQNACVWQTWQADYLRVCVDVQSMQLCFDLLQKGRWSLAEIVFKQNCFHACHTRFAVFFPLPWLPLCQFTNVYGRSHKKGCTTSEVLKQFIKIKGHTYIHFIHSPT